MFRVCELLFARKRVFDPARERPPRERHDSFRAVHELDVFTGRVGQSGVVQDLVDDDRATEGDLVEPIRLTGGRTGEDPRAVRSIRPSRASDKLIG